MVNATDAMNESRVPDFLTSVKYYVLAIEIIQMAFCTSSGY